MRNVIASILIFTICASLNVSCRRSSSTTSDSCDNDGVLPRVCLVNDWGDLSAAEIIHEIQLHPHRGYSEMVDLGTALLWEGNFDNATEVYEVAARMAETSPEVVGALYNKAIALVYAGNLKEALVTANLLARMVPDNTTVSWMRMTVSSVYGDELVALAARDQLLRLEPDVSGEEIFAVSGTVILGSVFIVAVSGTVLGAIALVPESDRKDVVLPLMKGYFSVVGIPIAQSSALTRTLPWGKARIS